MGYGVCNCVCGPPPHGICGACGIAGPYYVPPGGQRSTPSPPQTGTVIIREGVTEDQVRKIVREELQREAKQVKRK